MPTAHKVNPINSIISNIIIPKIGEPPGTRTLNLKIKSLLLCLLS